MDERRTHPRPAPPPMISGVFRGRGRVLHNGRAVATVDYTLESIPNVTLARAMGNPVEADEGVARLEGRVSGADLRGWQDVPVVLEVPHGYAIECVIDRDGRIHLTGRGVFRRSQSPVPSPQSTETGD